MTARRSAFAPTPSPCAQRTADSASSSTFGSAAGARRARSAADGMPIVAGFAETAWASVGFVNDWMARGRASAVSSANERQCMAREFTGPRPSTPCEGFAIPTNVAIAGPCPPHEPRIARPPDSAAIQPRRRKLLAVSIEGEVSWQRKLQHAAHTPDVAATRRTVPNTAATRAVAPSRPACRMVVAAGTRGARRRPMCVHERAWSNTGRRALAGISRPGISTQRVDRRGAVRREPTSRSARSPLRPRRAAPPIRSASRQSGCA